MWIRVTGEPDGPRDASARCGRGCGGCLKPLSLIDPQELTIGAWSTPETLTGHAINRAVVQCARRARLRSECNTKVFPVPSSNSWSWWFPVLIRLAPKHRCFCRNLGQRRIHDLETPQLLFCAREYSRRAWRPVHRFRARPRTTLLGDVHGLYHRQADLRGRAFEGRLSF